MARNRKGNRKNKSDGSRALAKVNMLAAQLRPELKFHDVIGTMSDLTIFDATSDPTGTFHVFALNRVPLGTDADERIGNNILNKWVTVRGGIYTTNTVGGDLVRVILGLWHPGDGATGFVMGDVLNVSSPMNIGATYRVDTKMNYTILSDKVYTPDTNSNERSLSFKINRRLNYKTALSEPTNDINHGLVFLIFYGAPITSTRTMSASSAVTLTANSRVYYTDC